jgi:HSP20 family protein
VTVPKTGRQERSRRIQLQGRGATGQGATGGTGQQASDTSGQSDDTKSG